MNSISYKLRLQDVIRPPFQDFLKTLSFRKTYLHTRRRDMFKYWFCYASSPMLPPSNYSKSRNLQWFRWSRSPWMYLILGMQIHLSPLASFLTNCSQRQFRPSWSPRLHPCPETIWVCRPQPAHPKTCDENAIQPWRCRIENAWLMGWRG